MIQQCRKEKGGKLNICYNRRHHQINKGKLSKGVKEERKRGIERKGRPAGILRESPAGDRIVNADDFIQNRGTSMTDGHKTDGAHITLQLAEMMK